MSLVGFITVVVWLSDVWWCAGVYSDGAGGGLVIGCGGCIVSMFSGVMFCGVVWGPIENDGPAWWVLLVLCPSKKFLACNVDRIVSS